MPEDSSTTESNKALPRYQPPPVEVGSPVNLPAGLTSDVTAWPPPTLSANTPPAYFQDWNNPQTSGYNAYSGPADRPPVSEYFQNQYPAFNPEDEVYRRVVKRVNAKLAFRKHLIAYIAINAIFWGIALIGVLSSGYTGRNPWSAIWPIWISLFWGIGLVSRYIRIYGKEDARRHRMIQEELRRMDLPGPRQ